MYSRENDSVMNPASILNKFLVWFSISLANQRNRVLAQTASVIGEKDLPDPIESFRRFEAA
jgi:hypothetical protein